MGFRSLPPRVRPDLTGRRVLRIDFVTPPPPRATPYEHIPFSRLTKRADLISLEEARCTPHLIYHSVNTLGDRPEGYAFSLVPLSIAAARDHVRRREEGFEMAEHRVWI